MAVLKRILVAEDDPHDQELTLEALAEHNLANEVDVVNDGQEALDYLFHEGAYSNLPDGHPIVVLLDIKMPKVDGVEVLRRLKNDPKLRFVPVVILTSSREERDLVESYALGANSYVVKPVDFDEFVDVVKELGLFWAMINEPPPGSIAKRLTSQSESPPSDSNEARS